MDNEKQHSLNSTDFEQQWLEKFSNGISKSLSAPICARIMRGSEFLTDDSNRDSVIAWSQRALELLDDNCDPKTRQDIMTACACHYPEDQLIDLKAAFEETGDIAVPHQMLQIQFENFLVNVLNLDQDTIAMIVEKGWGAAGILNGNTITAIKIPQSGNLREYLSADDPLRKRQLYCHCPRIRDIMNANQTISPTYCYCGAGFYQNIWEVITGRQIEVKVEKSVLQGDDYCQIAVKIAEE